MAEQPWSGLAAAESAAETGDYCIPNLGIWYSVILFQGIKLN